MAFEGLSIQDLVKTSQVVCSPAFSGLLLLINSLGWSTSMEADTYSLGLCAFRHVLHSSSVLGVDSLIRLSSASFPASVALLIVLFFGLILCELFLGNKKTKAIVRIIDIPVRGQSLRLYESMSLTRSRLALLFDTSMSSSRRHSSFSRLVRPSVALRLQRSLESS